MPNRFCVRPPQFVAPDDFIAVGAKVIERAARPGHGEAQAFFGAAAIGGIFRALVEGHGDVCAERDLHVHGVFGRKEVAASVEMRAEVNAFVRTLRSALSEKT